MSFRLFPFDQHSIIELKSPNPTACITVPSVVGPRVWPTASAIRRTSPADHLYPYFHLITDTVCMDERKSLIGVYITRLIYNPTLNSQAPLYHGLS